VTRSRDALVIPGEGQTGAARAVGVTVVICAYTQDRWARIRAAVASVIGQVPGPDEILLVIDHNAELADRARREIRGVIVLESDGARGLSGARNTGLRAARYCVTAFLDDDAVARPGWLGCLVEPYADPAVVTTGGSIHPRWPASRPSWLPPEFDWAVGCSYRGLPESAGPIRNPIGANMSIRTSLALSSGGFDCAVGRTATRPRGCEETELAIRLTAGRPGASVVYVPAASVDHHIASERTRFRYFARRCWHEGQSKAYLVGSVGPASGLDSERRYLTSVIPGALVRDLLQLLAGDPRGLARVAGTVAGVLATAAGYVTGRAPLRARAAAAAAARYPE
jgi:Glycosyl transferase family 2